MIPSIEQQVRELLAVTAYDGIADQTRIERLIATRCQRLTRRRRIVASSVVCSLVAIAGVTVRYIDPRATSLTAGGSDPVDRPSSSAPPDGDAAPVADQSTRQGEVDRSSDRTDDETGDSAAPESTSATSNRTARESSPSSGRGPRGGTSSSAKGSITTSRPGASTEPAATSSEASEPTSGTSRRAVRTSTSTAPIDSTEPTRSPHSTSVTTHPQPVGEPPFGGGESSGRIPPMAVTDRFQPTVIATSRELVWWGGWGPEGKLADGLAYDPATDHWRTLPAAPISGRTAPAAVAMGDDLFVWGGSGDSGERADGAIWIASTNRWRAIAAAPLSARHAASTVWTGREVVVWGGAVPGGASVDETFLLDGAAYDPSTDRWRTLTTPRRSGRAGVQAVWSGAEVLLWPTRAGEEAALDLLSGRWRSIGVVGTMPALNATWTGSEMVVCCDHRVVGTATAHAYDPESSRWRAFSFPDDSLNGSIEVSWYGGSWYVSQSNQSGTVGPCLSIESGATERLHMPMEIDTCEGVQRVGGVFIGWDWSSGVLIVGVYHAGSATITRTLGSTRAPTSRTSPISRTVATTI